MTFVVRLGNAFRALSSFAFDVSGFAAAIAEVFDPDGRVIPDGRTITEPTADEAPLDDLVHRVAFAGVSDEGKAMMAPVEPTLDEPAEEAPVPGSIEARIARHRLR